jgi:hypothetical protein
MKFLKINLKKKNFNACSKLLTDKFNIKLNLRYSLKVLNFFLIFLNAFYKLNFHMFVYLAGIKAKSSAGKKLYISVMNIKWNFSACYVRIVEFMFMCLNRSDRKKSKKIKKRNRLSSGAKVWGSKNSLTKK